MNNNLKYVINTAENYDKALSILHESLIEEGVLLEDIIYVYSNKNENKIYYNTNNVLCININYNFFEFSSILGISFLLKSDKKYKNNNFLLLHDTCKALRGFREKSLNLNEYINAKFCEIYWAHIEGRHNIGIFSSNAIIGALENTIKPFIAKNTKKILDKTLAIKMEWDLVPESLRFVKLKQLYPNRNDIKEMSLFPNYCLSKIYGEDKPRSICFMRSLNLIKYYVNLGPIHEKVGNNHPNTLL